MTAHAGDASPLLNAFEVPLKASLRSHAELANRGAWCRKIGEIKGHSRISTVAERKMIVTRQTLALTDVNIPTAFDENDDR